MVANRFLGNILLLLVIFISPSLPNPLILKFPMKIYMNIYQSVILIMKVK